MCVCWCVRLPLPSFLSPFQSFFFLVSFASQIHLLPPLSPTKMFCAAGEGGRGGVWQRKDIGRFSPSFLPLLSPRFRTQRETFFASEIYWVAGKLCVRGSTLLKWLLHLGEGFAKEIISCFSSCSITKKCEETINLLLKDAIR